MPKLLIFISILFASSSLFAQIAFVSPEKEEYIAAWGYIEPGDQILTLFPFTEDVISLSQSRMDVANSMNRTKHSFHDGTRKEVFGVAAE